MRMLAVALVGVALTCALAAPGAGADGDTLFKRPQALVVSPDGRSAYVSDRNSLFALSRNPQTGALTTLANYAGGGDHLRVSPDGRFVYLISNGWFNRQAGIYLFARNTTTGALTPAGMTGSTPGSLVLADDGVAYLGTSGAVRVLSRNVTTGKLTPRDTLEIADATGQLAPMPGRFMYASRQFPALPAILERGSDGDLKRLPDSTAEDDCFCYGAYATQTSGGAWRFTGLDPDISPDGRSLFDLDPDRNRLLEYGVEAGAPEGIQDHVGALAVDLETGAITPGGLHTTVVRVYRDGQDGARGLRYPSRLTLSPDGKFVYVAGGVPESDMSGTEATGRVAAFRRDPTTGALTFASLWIGPDGQPDDVDGVMKINDGNDYTNDPHVTLTFKRAVFGDKLEIANDGGFVNSKVVANNAQDRYSWTLASTGPDKLRKTVYARPVSSSGQLPDFADEVMTDDIVLDETVPKLVEARHVDGKRVLVRARDTISGVRALQITKDRDRPGRWRTYRKHRPRYKAGNGKLYVRVRDRARNRSRWRRVDD